MRKVFILSGLLSLHLCASNNSDYNYELGMAYLNGDRGVTMVTKMIPNCPYEKCAEVLNRDGTHTFSYPKKDLKSAMKYLGRAMKENHPKAAKEVLNLLQRRINWKEPKFDGYLVAHMQEDIGIGKDEFKDNMLTAVKVLQSNKVCEGFALGAEIQEKGYLDVKINDGAAKLLYAKAVDVCAPDSFSGMIASQKLKDLSKKD